MPALSAVLLDRDGTVIYDRHYLSDPEGVELLPGAVEGLRLLQGAGAELFLVTNQSGIGRGMFSEQSYLACHARLEELLQHEGLRFADSAFCPHAPEQQDCACRKPQSGMWERLRDTHGLSSETSVMIGDKLVDIAFGQNAGLAATVLVLTGKGEKEAAKLGIPALATNKEYAALDRSQKGQEHWPDAVARTLQGAAAFLLHRATPAQV